MYFEIIYRICSQKENVAFFYAFTKKGLCSWETRCTEYLLPHCASQSIMTGAKTGTNPTSD